MDDMVRAALKKWPNVPACTGWLALDARGDWYMRDDRTQAAGAFPLAKGSRIEHRQLREFIERNYEGDARRRLVLPERAAARLRRAGGGAARLAPGRARGHRARGALAHRARPRPWNRPGSTSAAGCSWPPTPASASCTRRTWRPPPTPSRPACGRRRRCDFAAMPARFGFCLSPAALWDGHPPREQRPATAEPPCGRQRKPPAGGFRRGAGRLTSTPPSAGGRRRARPARGRAGRRGARSRRRRRLGQLAAAVVGHVDHRAADFVVAEIAAALRGHVALAVQRRVQQRVVALGDARAPGRGVAELRARRAGRRCGRWCTGPRRPAGRSWGRRRPMASNTASLATGAMRAATAEAA